MATTNNYEVKLGFWTNWSFGKIQGATLTLTRQHGGFLIAFLAIFVGMVGKSFWRLGCFTMHRCFSSTKPQDGLYHQRQAILRNSDTAHDGIMRLFATMITWRSGRRARSPILRLFPVIVAAITISTIFGVASVFSSNVTRETLNQVLLTGSRCGMIIAHMVEDTSRIFTLLMPFETEKASQFLNYGRQCYTDETNADGCNLYTKPRLPLISTRGIACPFGADICKLGEDNLVMDTGMLDSLEDLGINIPLEYRFQLRLITTCAPLKTQGYMSDFNDTEYGAVKRYMYGSDGLSSDFTYQLPVNQAYVPSGNVSAGNFPSRAYQLGSVSHYASRISNLSSWSPIDALSMTDADVSLFFMSAPGILYSAPVTDPWFSAQRPSSEELTGDIRTDLTKLSAWEQDEPLGVMACAQQFQYCNPNLPEGERCEPLRGRHDISGLLQKIFPTDVGYEVINWVDMTWQNSIMISDMVNYIGASALRARYRLSKGLSGSLQDNQWQLEMEHLMKGTLASLQEVFVETANGIPEALEEFRWSPVANDTTGLMICANQKIVSNSYSSFNVLGVSLILVIGALIIMLDVGLGPTVVWWQRRKYRMHQIQDTEFGPNEKSSHSLYGALEWSQTSILQLQRLAHESTGYGDWNDCDKDVPVTKQGQLLACLDVCDIKHPRLQNKKLISISDSAEQFMPSERCSVEQFDSGLQTSAEGHNTDAISNSAVNGYERIPHEQNEQR